MPEAKNLGGLRARQRAMSKVGRLPDSPADAFGENGDFTGQMGSTCSREAVVETSLAGMIDTSARKGSDAWPDFEETDDRLGRIWPDPTSNGHKQ